MNAFPQQISQCASSKKLTCLLQVAMAISSVRIIALSKSEKHAFPKLHSSSDSYFLSGLSSARFIRLFNYVERAWEIGIIQ